MLLYRFAGLSVAPPQDLEEEQRAELSAVLVIHAQRAVTAGIQLSSSDWLALDEAERAAWLVASERVRIQHLCELAAAQRDELKAAELYAAVDGGEVHDDLCMDRVMRVAMLSMDGRA